MDSGQDLPDTKLSRRDFLKLGGLVLGGMVGGPIVRSLDKALETSENITVGNLELTPIITEHNKKTWQENGSDILNRLKEFKIVIPEYFPPDYEHSMKNNQLLDKAINLTNYDDSNYLFTEISNYLLRQSKQVLVVDPAYSEAFVKLRLSRNWWMPILGGFATSIPFLTKKDSKTGEINIKKTLVAATVGLVAGTYTAGCDHDPTGIELDIRHVFIAESLTQIGKGLVTPTKAALIYPGGHWKGEIKQSMQWTNGILFYLQNPKERQEKFNKYCETFANKKKWQDFYKIRRYTSDNNKWEKQTEIELRPSFK